MNKYFLIAAFAAVLFVGATAVQAETIVATVPVGDTGNTGDSAANDQGAVDYAYRIGTHEVAAGQYRDFLNDVAATYTYGLWHTNMDSGTAGCGLSTGTKTTSGIVRCVPRV